MHEAVRDKKEVARVLEIIKEVPRPDTDSGASFLPTESKFFHSFFLPFSDADFNPLQIELFVHVVMGMYAKTFTHLFAALSK